MIRPIVLLATVAALAACTQEAPAAGADAAETAETTDTTQAAAPAPPPEILSAIDAEWPAGSPAVTPAEVEAMIDADGAEATVNALRTAGGDSRWNTAMRGIALGEDEWVRIAAPLGDGARDGGVDNFGYAMSFALITNPEGVLGAVDTWSGHVQTVCTAGLRGLEEAAVFHTAAIAAVEAVEDTAAQAGVCLSALRAEQAG